MKSPAVAALPGIFLFRKPAVMECNNTLRTMYQISCLCEPVLKLALQSVSPMLRMSDRYR